MDEQSKDSKWSDLTKGLLDLCEGEATLLCPACGDAGVHLGGVRTVVGVEDRYGSALTERSRDGDFPFDKVVDPLVGRRGAQIEIGVFCENGGHISVLGLQFHKGMTFLKWKLIPGESDELRDLWRT